VLHKALNDAERDGVVVRNVCKLQKAPKVPDSEMPIVTDLHGFVAKIAAEPLRPMAIMALFTGVRLGEVLALRDRALDLDAGVLHVREALEETKANGITFKPPKSKAGRRSIKLPDIVIEALREHRRRLLETRMKLGRGKLASDDLLFANWSGAPLRPSVVSSDWGDLAERIGMPGITFHGLRHSHASQCIAAGVDIVTLSKRLGHAKPSVTLAVYAHMFNSDDSKAADAVNAIMSR
jgi:integrase